MASLPRPRQLTSVVLAFALSGSPAVLAACMALCVQGVATPASHEGSTAERRAVPTPLPDRAVASGHAHHVSPAPNEPAATAANGAPSHEWSDARLSGVCSDCCSNGQLARVAGTGVERVDVLSLGAGPAASRAASFLLTASVLGASLSSPPVPPPSPSRAPLVLRI